jgi:hypothetical protein
VVEGIEQTVLRQQRAWLAEVWIVFRNRFGVVTSRIAFSKLMG